MFYLKSSANIFGLEGLQKDTLQEFSIPFIGKLSLLSPEFIFNMGFKFAEV